MEKQHILDEIRRTAAANGGKPLGWRRFSSETGINHRAWEGRFWARWGDALREAGLEPNQLTEAYTNPDYMPFSQASSVSSGDFPLTMSFA